MGTENSNEASTASTASGSSESDVNWTDLNDSVPGGDDLDSDSYDEGAPTSSDEGSAEGGASDDQADSGAEGTPAKTDASTDNATSGTSQQEETAPVEIPVLEQQAQLTPEQIAAQQAEYTKWLGEQEKILEGMYALDEETSEQIQTEPELVLPKLMASMHMKMQQQLFAGLQAVLPHMLEQVNAGSVVEQKAQTTFYGEFPELKAHHDKVLEVGRLYRTLNPKATPEQAVKAIGLLTAQTLGIELKGGVQSASPAKPAVTAPARPIRPGSAGAKPAVKQADNPFADLLDD